MRLCPSCVGTHAVPLAMLRHLYLLSQPGFPTFQNVGSEAQTGPNEVIYTVHSLSGL